MTDPLFVRGLVFGYPGVPLFDGWTHAFGPGLTWLRGANGCGKSTLLQLIGGALEPRVGTVRLGAIDARDAAIEYRRRVYWCGPDGVAFDHLTPPEFFGFVATLYPTFDADAAATAVRAFALDAVLARRIGTLSTGTRRKVAVVAAFAVGTPVVLLDEPLAGLDRASLQVATTRLADAASRRDRVWIVASHEPLGAAARAAAPLDLSPRA